ncbi:MAG: thioredoxin domain-containing protein [Pyrinomonadaceae bacterium]|nr:thioredoxin domain-containing protein [Pyrinomonadaceae bacterium]
MKLLLVVCVLSAGVVAQEVYTPLATMNGRSFTVQDLPSDVGNAWQKLPSTLIQARKDLLELQIDNLLLLQEAKKRAMKLDTLIDIEVHSKVAKPSEATIKATYEKNKASLNGMGLEQVREPIVNYLKSESEKKAMDAYRKKLRSAAKIEYVTDVNKSKPSLNDVFATVNAEPITYAMYKRKNGLPIYEYEANVFDQMDSSLRLVVDSAVYSAEAQSRGIPVNKLMADEVTSKIKEFSPTEYKRLENALKQRLYEKYRVKYFVKEPKPYKQRVSVDDDPVMGKNSANVTIVVFADFECPACAGVHPVIKSLVQKYGDRVRLVYRDFPLPKVHKNAIPAARAAFAANKQGKFFEYSEKLYQNQANLDEASLVKYAAELKLDTAKFSADMKSPESMAEIEKDIADAKEYGVAGTPSIFVNGYKIRTLSVQAFENAVERALSGSL